MNNPQSMKKIITVLTITGAILGLAGCSSEKSDIKTAVAQYYQDQPQASWIQESYLPVAIPTPVDLANGGVQLVSYVAKDGDDSVKAQAFARLTKEGWTTADKQSGYLLSNGKIAQVQVVDTKSDDYQAMLESLKHINADTDYTFSVSDPGLPGNVVTTYVPFSPNGYSGTPDQSFFTAVPQNSTSPFAKLLAALADKGYLTAKKMDVYLAGYQGVIGKLDPSRIGNNKTTPMVMYFKNDKTDGMVSLSNTQFTLTMLKRTFGKPLTFNAKVNQGFFSGNGMVYTSDIEATSTVTPFASMPEVKAMLSYGDLHDLSTLDSKAGTKIVQIRVVAYGPRSQPSASIGKSKYTGSKLINYIVYEPSKDHSKRVDYGNWKVTDVVSYDKKPNADGNINAQIKFTFNQEPVVKSQPDLATFIGQALITDGKTKTISCNLMPMKNGYQVNNCDQFN